MTVKVRSFRNGGWEIDIRLTLPDGTRHRERRRAPVSSKTRAREWGLKREGLLLAGLAVRDEKPEEPIPEREEVPTVEEFIPRYMKGYVEANREKHSSMCAKRSILKKHIEPLLGDLRLDEVSHEQVQGLKAGLAEKHPKTVNNILTTLSTLLKTAVKWRVIDSMPCTIEMLKVPPSGFRFYELDELERLVEAAAKLSQRHVLMILLGGQAGLRLGEIIALEWSDLDLRRGSIHVQRSVWQGRVGSPKGGRSRRVPMTRRLRQALAAHRHLRGPRVLYRDGGSSVAAEVLREWMRVVTRRAGLEESGALHPLRHTFCSHLAMRGAPTRAIQELAGHAHLSTTQRYMHLSPSTRSGGPCAARTPADLTALSGFRPRSESSRTGVRSGSSLRARSEFAATSAGACSGA